MPTLIAGHRRVSMALTALLLSALLLLFLLFGSHSVGAHVSRGTETGPRGLADVGDDDENKDLPDGINHHLQGQTADAAALLQVSTGFLEFVSRAAVSVLTDRLSRFHIPNRTVELDVPVLGNIQLHVWDLQVLASQSRTAAISANQSPVLDGQPWNLLVDRVDVEVTCQWRWRKGVLFSGGRARVTTNNSLIAMDVGFGGAHVAADPVMSGWPGRHNVSLHVLGRPRIEFGQATVHISQSRLSWLYNWLRDTFVRNLEQTMGDFMSQQLMMEFPRETNDLIQQLPVSKQLWKGVHVVFPVLRAPAFSDRYLELAVGATVAVQSSGTDLWTACPRLDLAPTAFVRNTTQGQKMVYISIQQKVANCLLWALNKVSFFQTDFTLTLDGKRRDQGLAGGAWGWRFKDQLAAVLLDPNMAPVNHIQLSIGPSAAYPPRLEFRESGMVRIVVEECLIRTTLHLGPVNRTHENWEAFTRPPFVVVVKVNTSFEFEPHVFYSSTPGADTQWTLVPMPMSSSTMMEYRVEGGEEAASRQQLTLLVPLLSSMAHPYLMDALHSVREQVLFPSLKEMERLPVPIGLPWPLDAIRIRDFLLNIRAARWNIAVDFGLE